MTSYGTLTFEYSELVHTQWRTWLEFGFIAFIIALILWVVISMIRSMTDALDTNDFPGDNTGDIVSALAAGLVGIGLFGLVVGADLGYERVTRTAEIQPIVVSAQVDSVSTDGGLVSIHNNNTDKDYTILGLAPENAPVVGDKIQIAVTVVDDQLLSTALYMKDDMTSSDTTQYFSAVADEIGQGKKGYQVGEDQLPTADESADASETGDDQ